MADNTKIEWADATLNYVNGCSVLSPGCTNCYAMKQAHRFDVRRGLTQKTKGGMVWTGEVRANERALQQALAWKRGRKIFWNAHGDLFHDSVPDEWIDRLFAVCALTPQHTHMILTKRSARMRDYVEGRLMIGAGVIKQMGTWSDLSPNERCIALLGIDEHTPTSQARPLPNVWLGVSVEDQARAEERIPDLLATPAAVRFVSCEPLLGPVYLTDVSDGGTALDPECWGDCACDILYGYDPGCRKNGGDGSLTRKIDWVIVGGESGPGARPMHPDWARSLRDQCAEAGVPFHFKQWGNWAPCEAIGNDNGGVDLVPPARFSNVHRWRRWDDDTSREARDDESAGEFLSPGTLAIPVGKKQAGRLLDGVEHNGVPQP